MSNPLASTLPSGPLTIGSLSVPTRFFLAPLAGYTNLGFRLALRELGGLGLATSDLINARALVQNNRKTLDMIHTCPADRPLAIQIYGTAAEEMRDAAQWLEAYGVSTVDINMGCPVRKVTRHGGGSALLCDAGKTIELVRSIVGAVRIPVTVKMRLGWDATSLTAPFFAREFEQAGVAAVTIHGRTREQGFGGAVCLNSIRAVVEAVERIPVVGNGNICTIDDACQMFAQTGCAAIAVGRGALLNPWFFAQLARCQAHGEPGPSATYQQRLEFMARHFHLLVADRGERLGCLLFRKVANWYCKVLRPGREIQQRLVRLESVPQFAEILDELQRMISASGRESDHLNELEIAVPQGPVERW